MNPAEAQSVGEAFVTFYYTQFDRDRSSLAGVYVPQSFLSYEGDVKCGAQAIVEKFSALSFRSVQHQLTTVDTQPTVDGSVLVAVVGQLKTDDDAPHSFTEVFSLKSVNGSYVILNQIFRLALHHM